MFDRVVQQIVLQYDQRPSSDIDSDTPKLDTKLDPNPDISVLNIDVKRIVKLLVKEEELVAARNKADDLERENGDMQGKLAKKEHELDLRMQEKEDLETSLSRMRERLEKESASHSQAVQRALTAEMRAEDLQHRFVQEQHERMRLERLVNEGSIPDDQKVLGLKGGNGQVSPPVSTITVCAPPPPPPLFMPPPPPPVPGAPQISNTQMIPNPMPPKIEMTKKNIPQPGNPLKSFNWSKLPDAKVQGTIWNELDDTKWYNNMELESIDKIFSAYQKNGVAVIKNLLFYYCRILFQYFFFGLFQNDGSIEDLRMMGKTRTKILSVIDGRRAQNCTILLSKLKMSDEDISK